MSWSASTPIVSKAKAHEVIGLLTLDDGPMFDQLLAAKDAAKLLLKSIPGPYIRVAMNGHANGVGWEDKPGYASDSITITVQQAFKE